MDATAAIQLTFKCGSRMNKHEYTWFIQLETQRRLTLGDSFKPTKKSLISQEVGFRSAFPIF